MSKAIKPLISIITVVYNGIDSIEKTIKNVLEQTYINIEYIIIDGGSNDGTKEIIEKYQNSITYWISEPDKGIYDAMNKGLIVAKGEWVHFRNCGDYFFNTNVLEDIFESHIIPDNIGIVTGNIYYFNEYGYLHKTPSFLRTSYKKDMPFFHPSTFIRTKLHQEIPYDLNYKLSADYAFFFNCLENKVDYLYIDKIISLFNAIDGKSTANRIKGLKENYYITKKYLTKKEKFTFKIFIWKYQGKILIKKFLPGLLKKKYSHSKYKKGGWVKSDMNNIIN